jgi:hypothetical protein
MEINGNKFRQITARGLLLVNITFDNQEQHIKLIKL